MERTQRGIHCDVCCHFDNTSNTFQKEQLKTPIKKIGVKQNKNI